MSSIARRRDDEYDDAAPRGSIPEHDRSGALRMPGPRPLPRGGLYVVPDAAYPERRTEALGRRDEANDAARHEVLRRAGIREPRAARAPRPVLGLLPLWLVVYAFLNIGDLVSTHMGLGVGMNEGNPLMAGLLDRFGFAALIGYKGFVVVVVSVGVLLLAKLHPRIAGATVAVCNALVGLAVVINLTQFVLR